MLWEYTHPHTTSQHGGKPDVVAHTYIPTVATLKPETGAPRSSLVSETNLVGKLEEMSLSVPNKNGGRRLKSNAQGYLCFI